MDADSSRNNIIVYLFMKSKVNIATTQFCLTHKTQCHLSTLQQKAMMKKIIFRNSFLIEYTIHTVFTQMYYFHLTEIDEEVKDFFFAEYLREFICSHFTCLRQ